MSNPPAEDRERAAALATRARALHEQKDYYQARDLYQQSLDLVEDDEVRASYRRLMATIGPM
jgi:hypothetical protein